MHTLLSSIQHKATGPDGTPGRLLKTCADELSGVFKILFQTSIDSGMVPDEWKSAHIVPVFKKGDKTVPENYRPISLTSISCKILEHVIHSTVMDHLDRHNLLTPLQHGFRQNRNGESQIITTTRDFAQPLNQHGQTDAILLDFSKAFDKVEHSILLSKAHSLGISGPLLQWIRSFLFGRTQTGM